MIGVLIYQETLVMAYKCLNKLAPEYLSGCLSKNSDYHLRVLRKSETDLLISLMKKSYGKNSFAFCGAKEWNNLDSAAKLAISWDMLFIALNQD